MTMTKPSLLKLITAKLSILKNSISVDKYSSVY